jgi:hypothetical protein
VIKLLTITSYGKLEHSQIDYQKVMREVMSRVLSQLDPESARLFLDRFTEKMNEQKCTQENSGTSR